MYKYFTTSALNVEFIAVCYTTAIFLLVRHFPGGSSCVVSTPRQTLTVRHPGRRQAVGSRQQAAGGRLRVRARCNSHASTFACHQALSLLHDNRQTRFRRQFSLVPFTFYDFTFILVTGCWLLAARAFIYPLFTCTNTNYIHRFIVF